MCVCKIIDLMREKDSNPRSLSLSESLDFPLCSPASPDPLCSPVYPDPYHLVGPFPLTHSSIRFPMRRRRAPCQAAISSSNTSPQPNRASCVKLFFPVNISGLPLLPLLSPVYPKDVNYLPTTLVGVVGR